MQLRTGRGEGVEERARGCEILDQPERSGDLGQQDPAGELRIGRLGSRPKSALTRSRIVEVPQRVDLRLVGTRIVQSGRKTKTSTTIRANNAVRYVIE